jgi:hypothetical protein
MEFEHEYLGSYVPKATFVQCSCAAREPPDGYISLLIFCRSELITQVGTLQNPFPQIQTIKCPSTASLNKNSILSAETQDLSTGMGDLSQGSKSHHTGSKGFCGMIPSGRLPLREEHRRRPAIPDRSLGYLTHWIFKDRRSTSRCSGWSCSRSASTLLPSTGTFDHPDGPPSLRFLAGRISGRRPVRQLRARVCHRNAILPCPLRRQLEAVWLAEAIVLGAGRPLLHCWKWQAFSGLSIAKLFCIS